MKNAQLILSALCEHTPVEGSAVVTAPSCTVGGYTTYTCAKCNKNYTADETEPAGHDFVNGVCATCHMTNAPEAGVAYKWALGQFNLGKTLFFNGGMSKTYYGGTTESIEEAVDVYLETVEGGYYIYFLDEAGAKQYITIVVNGTHKNFTISAEPANVYTFDTTYNTLVTTVSDVQVYIGTYEQHDTFSISEYSRLAGSVNFPAYFYAVELEAPKCEHTNVTYTDLGNGTHKIVCECGEELIEDHSYADTNSATTAVQCAHCTSKSFKFLRVGPDLGSSLSIKFFFMASTVKGTGNYIVIEQEGKDPVIYHQGIATEWEPQANGQLYQIVFKGVTAKEMADEFRVTLYNSEGKKLSATYVTSLADYLLSVLNTDSETDLKKSVYVDLLNYGAAAQKYFGYKTETLANAGVTAEQQAKYASPVQPQTDQSSYSGVKYVRLGAEVGNTTTLNVYYQTSKVPNVAKAEVSYVNYHGDDMSTTITDFEYYSNGALLLVKVNNMVIADCEILINIKLLAADGTVLATVTDSIGSYVARDTSGAEIYPAIMKLCYSARNYFDSQK